MVCGKPDLCDLTTSFKYHPFAALGHDLIRGLGPKGDDNMAGRGQHGVDQGVVGGSDFAPGGKGIPHGLGHPVMDVQNAARAGPGMAQAVDD